jgi:hypothetical protein
MTNQKTQSTKRDISIQTNKKSTPGGARTRDPQIRSLMLYQLSHQRIFNVLRLLQDLMKTGVKVTILNQRKKKKKKTKRSFSSCQKTMKKSELMQQGSRNTTCRDSMHKSTEQTQAKYNEKVKLRNRLVEKSELIDG